MDNDTQRDVINRLKRVEGQVRGLQRMIEQGRPCHEVLALLSGVRRALDASGDVVLERYLAACQTDPDALDSAAMVAAVRLARG